MKLKFTLVFEHEVEDLEHYEAKTLEEAAANQKAWIDDGSTIIHELLPDQVDVTVEAIHD